MADLHWTMPIARWTSISTTGMPGVEFIDPMVRRRLSRLSRLALQAAHDCVGAHGALRVVFASRHGELTRTTGILEDISAAEPISPLRSAFPFSTPQAACSASRAATGPRHGGRRRARDPRLCAARDLCAMRVRAVGAGAARLRARTRRSGVRRARRRCAKRSAGDPVRCGLGRRPPDLRDERDCRRGGGGHRDRPHAKRGAPALLVRARERGMAGHRCILALGLA